MKKAIILPIIIALLVAVPLAGCAEEKEGVLPHYAVGNYWTYRWVQDAAEYTLTQEVTGEEVVEGKNCYAMDWTYEPPMGGMSTMNYWVDKETLSLLSKMQFSGEHEGQPYTWTAIYSYELLEGSYWPLEVGKEFMMEGTETTTITVDDEVVSSGTITRTSIFKVEKKEEIEVPAGRFNCFKVVITDEDENLLYVGWYSDKAKSEVKSIAYDEDGNATYTMELKSYSV